MIWKRLFDPQPRSEQAWPLYEIIVAQARNPVLYRDYGVPDSVDGRFEAIVLHLVLVLRRLKRDFPDGLDLAQALQEVFFTDMDRSLREMGAGDLGVGKRVRRMAEGFMGRLSAYEAALDAIAPRGTGELETVLRRNAFGTLPAEAGDTAALAAYILAQTAALEAQEGVELRQGRLTFAAPPAAVPEASAKG
ncbi:ubiquinol-cytochrome C chaperone family protein [Pelagibius marinus]|uniref:ubiquinol-cytochrome C chaperone family protein n=1 Tax=Pelagibius marinus TaxID=2762760 RepID=UPI0018733636|nr:ubiquinol-cytochrome C chaperone family protein [Pelagibius marinus]